MLTLLENVFVDQRTCFFFGVGYCQCTRCPASSGAEEVPSSLTSVVGSTEYPKRTSSPLDVPFPARRWTTSYGVRSDLCKVICHLLRHPRTMLVLVNFRSRHQTANIFNVIGLHRAVDSYRFTAAGRSVRRSTTRSQKIDVYIVTICYCTSLG